MDVEFKVFTFNCWGIAGISKNRRHRINAIAEELAKSDYNVVCLQEIWTDRDFFLIKEIVKKVLPYSHYFYSGVVGSGICIFSKHQIKEAFFHQWSLNGYMHKLHHGDWFGGKGVGLCKLTLDQFTINIYSAHLHAEYDRNSDEYQAHRILQAYDTAQFIMLTSENCDLVVLAGDLNTEPGDLAYRILLHMPGLIDGFSKANDVPQDCVATCESLRNSYTPSSHVKRSVPGKRIDYIMFHPGSKLQVDLKNYRLPLPERVPNHSFSYSDHEAVAATLVISKKKVSDVPKNEADKVNVLENCLTVLNAALHRLTIHKIMYLISAILLFVLLLVSFVFDSPFGFPIIFNILRVIATAVIIFCTLMATVWNKIEKHGVLAVKLAIEINLQTLNKDL